MDTYGEVSVTGVMAASWKDFSDRLQPTFKLDADAMVGRVLPITQRTEDKQLQAVGLQGRVAVPSTDFGLDVLGGAQTDPPDFSKLSAADLPGTAQLGELDDDPMLQYHLAFALYQEVAMLNEFVRRVTAPSGGRAYVVRINLQAMMYTDNPPVDLYSTLSFFDGRLGLADQDHHAKTVQVMPMVVTDSVEAALRSRSERRVRELALTLAGGIGSVGGSSSFASKYDKIRSALGQNYNSTYQVIRSSDNTIRVKVGASHQVGEGPGSQGLVSRTIPITLLVFMDEHSAETNDESADDRVVTVVARNAYRDARTGRLKPSGLDLADRLGALKRSELYRLYGVGPEIDRIFAEYALQTGKGEDPRETIVGKLAIAITDNDYSQFLQALPVDDFPRLRAHGPFVWAAMVEGFSDTQVSMASITLDAQRKPRLQVISGSVNTLLDDGSQLSATFPTGSDLDPSRLAAELLAVTGTGEDREILRIPARGITVENAGTAVKVVFPHIMTQNLGRSVEYLVSIAWYDARDERYKPIVVTSDQVLESGLAQGAPMATESELVQVYKERGFGNDSHSTRLLRMGAIPVERLETRKAAVTSPIRVVPASTIVTGNTAELRLILSSGASGTPLDRWEIEFADGPVITSEQPASPMRDLFEIAGTRLRAKSPRDLQAQLAGGAKDLIVKLGSLEAGKSFRVRIRVNGEPIEPDLEIKMRGG